MREGRFRRRQAFGARARLEDFTAEGLEGFRDDLAHHPAVIDGQDFVAHRRERWFYLLRFSAWDFISLGESSNFEEMDLKRISGAFFPFRGR
jgi:hypothetical protein